MSRNYDRKLFVFNMAEPKFEFFLNRDGEICEDFSPNCIFFDSVQAMNKIKEFESTHKNFNLQIELVPPSINSVTYSNRDFWLEYIHQREFSYKKERENKDVPYNGISLSDEALAYKINQFWKESKNKIFF